MFNNPIARPLNLASWESNGKNTLTGTRMLRLARFVIYVLYRYYSNGKRSEGAYDKAVMVLFLFLWLNFMTVAALLGFLKTIYPSSDIPVSEKYLFSLSYVVPFYVLIRWLFKRDVIMTLSYDEETIERGGLAFLLYCVLSVIAAISVVAFSLRVNLPF
jgi:hypothetical protein